MPIDKTYTNQIKTVQDVKDFFNCLLTVDKTAFHPDDNFKDYTDKSGKPSYTPAAAQINNKLMDICFDICRAAKEDIYEIAMNCSRLDINTADKSELLKIKKHLRKRNKTDYMRLFNAVWRDILAFKRASQIDDLQGLYDQLVSEKVNNSRSSFWIYGK
jgi:hypothetical protein